MDEKIEEIPIYEVAGSFREMGQQFGEACREKVHELYEIRLENALEHAKDRGRELEEERALVLAEDCLKVCQTYFPEGYDEFLGICEGADISAAELYICQGLTDFRDFLSWGALPDGYGCTSLIIPASKTENKHILLGQTWDLQTNNMPYVCLVKRQPSNAPQTVYMTTTGGLALIGMNEHGLSIGTNNIKCNDSRLGLHYLFIIHKFLQYRNIAKALPSISEAQRAGAHYYYYADECHYGAVECSAKKHAFVQNGSFIQHSNHCLLPEIKELESEDAGESSIFRSEQVKKLLKNHQEHSTTTIKNILSDQTGNALAINRYNYKNISSNGSVIMEPASKRFWACRTQADRGKWKEVSLG